MISQSVQIIAYADDVALTAMDKRHLQEALLKLAAEANKRGLETNQEKTLYMRVTGRNSNDRNTVDH